MADPTRISSLGMVKNVTKNLILYSTMTTEDTQVLGREWELNQARSKPNPVNRPVRTGRTIMHHYNGTQYCNTETVLLIILFLQTNITSQIRPRGGIMPLALLLHCFSLPGHFSVAAPKLWNSLSARTRSANTSATFRSSQNWTFFGCLLLGRFSWTQRIRFACDNCALQIGFMLCCVVELKCVHPP